MTPHSPVQHPAAPRYPSCSPAHVHVQTRLQVRDKKKWDPDAAIKSRNEPANLRQVLEAVAGARGMEAGALAAQVHANALALFFSG